MRTLAPATTTATPRPTAALATTLAARTVRPTTWTAAMKSTRPTRAGPTHARSSTLLATTGMHRSTHTALSTLSSLIVTFTHPMVAHALTHMLARTTPPIPGRTIPTITDIVAAVTTIPSTILNISPQIAAILTEVSTIAPHVTAVLPKLLAVLAQFLPVAVNLTTIAFPEILSQCLPIRLVLFGITAQLTTILTQFPTVPAELPAVLANLAAVLEAILAPLDPLGVVGFKALPRCRVILFKLFRLLGAPLLATVHELLVALGVGLFQVLKPILELLPMLRHQLAEAFRIVLL